MTSFGPDNGVTGADQVTTRLALPLRRRLLSGSAWALAGKIFTASGGFAANAMITRLLSPPEVGAYFLLVSVVTVAVSVAQFGLQRAVVRLVAQALASADWVAARGVVRRVLIFGLCSSLFVGLAIGVGGRVIGMSLFHSPLMVSVMWLGAGWIVLRTLLTLHAESFRGLHDIRMAVAFNGLTTNILLVALLASYLWLGYRAGLTTVVLTAVFATFVSLMAAAILMRGQLGDVGYTVAPPWRHLAHVGAPLLVASLAIFIFSQADIWIIGAYLPKSDVAIYGAASRLVQLVATPLLIVNAVLPPIISDLYKRGQAAQLERTLRGMVAVAGIPAIFTLLGITLAASPILGLVYGNYYRAATDILVLLSLGQLVNVWAGSGILVLMMTDHQVPLMRLTAFFAVLLIGGDILVVHRFGVAGVAAMSGSIMASQAVAVLLLTKRTTGMWCHFGPGHLVFVIKRFRHMLAGR